MDRRVKRNRWRDLEGLMTKYRKNSNAYTKNVKKCTERKDPCNSTFDSSITMNRNLFKLMNENSEYTICMSFSNIFLFSWQKLWIKNYKSFISV